jgi:hypothetical protein
MKGYRILLGGKLGRHPQLAREILGIFNDQEVLQIVEACLDLYKNKSKGGKRFAEIRKGTIKLIWSYILDYENNKNPFQKRKDQIRAWKKYAIEDIQESSKIIEMARSLNKNGFPKIDSLHISYAIITQGGYFLTTDDKILKLSTVVKRLKTLS